MKYVIILLAIFCVGCVDKNLDFTSENVEYLSEFIVNVKERLEKLEAKGEKSDYSNTRRRMSNIETEQSVYGKKWMNCEARLDDLERPYEITVYDPNAPELKFLGPTDPNWARDFGDTREIRELYNICLNRGLINRDRQVLAEVCKRMLAIEARLDPNDPNGVKE